MATTAKLFKNGQSQAIRLPKEFRMPGTEVKITPLGHGILIEPIEKDFSNLLSALELFTADFLQEGRNQPTEQQREDVFA